MSARPTEPSRGWAGRGETPTTLVVVRHGVTVHTAAKRFSGGLGGDNPGLSDEGREQIAAVGEWLAPQAAGLDAVVCSPVRRTAESAAIIAERLGLPSTEEPGFAEMEFGAWDGLTFSEVGERHGEDLSAWLGSLDVVAGGADAGGESFRQVEERVAAARERVIEAHRGRSVVVVSHVTPIKTLVAHAVGAPLDAVFRMELSPASVTVISYVGDQSSLRLYNALPPGRDGFVPGLP